MAISPRWILNPGSKSAPGSIFGRVPNHPSMVTLWRGGPPGWLVTIVRWALDAQAGRCRSRPDGGVVQAGADSHAIGSPDRRYDRPVDRASAGVRNGPVRLQAKNRPPARAIARIGRPWRLSPQRARWVGNGRLRFWSYPATRLRSMTAMGGLPRRVSFTSAIVTCRRSEGQRFGRYRPCAIECRPSVIRHRRASDGVGHAPGLASGDRRGRVQCARSRKARGACARPWGAPGRVAEATQAGGLHAGRRRCAPA